jgi:hypothetical protein
MNDFSMDNLDKSLFTFEWVKYENTRLHKTPQGPWNFKFDIQYKDENGKLVKEKASYSDMRVDGFFDKRKDLYFYQPYVSESYKNHFNNQRDACAYDLSNYGCLLNELREAYKKARKGEPFIAKCDRKSLGFHTGYKLDFKAKLGEAILIINIGDTHSSFFEKDEFIEIDSIKKFDETLGIIKRRIPYLNRKLDEFSNEYRRVCAFPTFKNGEEKLLDKLSNILGNTHGNTDGAKKVFDFLKSDEFKSFFEE